MSYEIRPSVSASNINVSLEFEATANPVGCPAPIVQSRFDNCPVPLPVTLIRFEAQPDDDNNVWLNWQTASETNNHGFYVEKSRDGFDYREIGFVPGTGSSQKVQSYSFLDTEGEAGRWYYRLRQIDFDGTKSYSRVVTATLDGSDELLETLVVYPNPATNSVKIDGVSNEQPLALSIINASGQVVWSKDKVSLSEAAEIDVSGFSRGFYIFHFKVADTVITKKVVLQ